MLRIKISVTDHMGNPLQVADNKVRNAGVHCSYLPKLPGRICVRVHDAGIPQNLVASPLDITVYRNYPLETFSMPRFDLRDNERRYGGIAADPNSTMVSNLSNYL